MRLRAPRRRPAQNVSVSKILAKYQLNDHRQCGQHHTCGFNASVSLGPFNLVSVVFFSGWQQNLQNVIAVGSNLALSHLSN